MSCASLMKAAPASSGVAWPIATDWAVVLSCVATSPAAAGGDGGSLPRRSPRFDTKFSDNWSGALSVGASASRTCLAHGMPRSTPSTRPDGTSLMKKLTYLMDSSRFVDFGLTLQNWHG